MKFSSLISDCNALLLDEFGFSIKKSTNTFVSETEWSDLLNNNGLSKTSEGFFLPRFLSSYLNVDSNFLPINLFHEFFGHGLFCEHSLIGKKIVSLEQELKIMEAPFNKKNSSVISIPSNSSVSEKYISKRNELKNFFHSQNNNYEGFAMWLEHKLSNEFGFKDKFHMKLDSVVDSCYVNLFEQFQKFSDEFGSFALISQLDFPKYYSNEVLVDLLKNVYKDDYSSIQLAVLYGSRKPYSDIDLFIVSDKISSRYYGWLDIFSTSKSYFDFAVKNFSIDVTDPLFSGTPIVENGLFLDSLKKQINSNPITSDSIKYNYSRSAEQKDVSSTYSSDSREHILAKSYSASFKENALSLEKGSPLLILK